jgi:creatinase
VQPELKALLISKVGLNRSEPMAGKSEFGAAGQRPDYYRFHQGEKVLPFADTEYEVRLSKLRAIMAEMGVDACVLTSMHNVAYYSGFLYCAFGRPYAQVVTATEAVTFSAGIDAAQPWRRCYGDNITYTDWQRNNYWRAIQSVTGPGKVIGFEGDHLSIAQMALLDEFLTPASKVDIAPATMMQRFHKSPAELELIRAGAATADVGGYAVRDAIKAGTREIDVAMAGREGVDKTWGSSSVVWPVLR